MDRRKSAFIAAVFRAGFLSSERVGGARRSALLAAFLLAGSAAATAHAETRSWAAAADGNWSDPGRWEPAIVPTDQDLVLFAAEGAGVPYTVTFTGTANANDLQVSVGQLAFDLAGEQLRIRDKLYVGTTPRLTAELRFLGGTVNVGGTSVHYVGGSAAGPAADGKLVIDGSDVHFTHPDSRLVVGYTGGRGELVLVNGGELTLPRLVLGAGSNSNGHLAIGSGSRVIVGGALRLGDGNNNAAVRTSSLSITGGGYLRTGDAFVGINRRSYAEVDIASNDAAAPSVWDVAGNLFVGGTPDSDRNTQGQITLGPDGRLNVAGNLRIFDKNATKIVIDGGELFAGTFDGSNDQKRIEFRSGTIGLTNSSAFVGSGSPLGQSLTLGQGQTLSVISNPANPRSGLFSVTRDGNLALSGGTLRATSVDLSNAGAFNFIAGSLIVDRGALLSPPVLDFGGPDYGTRPHLQFVNGATIANATTLAVGSPKAFGSMTVSGGSRLLLDGVRLDGPSQALRSEVTVIGPNSSLQTLQDFEIGSGGRLNVVGGATVSIAESLLNSGNVFLAPTSVLRVSHFAMNADAVFEGGGMMFMTSGSFAGDGFCNDTTLVIEGAASAAPGTVMCVDSIVFSGAAGPQFTMQSDGGLANAATLRFDNELVSSATANPAAITRALAGVIDLMSPLLGTAQVRSFTVNEASTAETPVEVDMLIESKITNGELRKAGAGTLRLTNAGNDFAKSYIANGVLESAAPGTLGTGEVVFQGGTLSLHPDGAGDLAWPNHLNATAASARVRVGGLGAGALGVPSLSISTQNLEVSGGRALQISGPVTLSGNPTIKASADLILAGAITRNDATPRNLTISEPDDAPAATVTFTGALANNYDGITRINAGTLLLSKPAGVAAVPGRLEVFGGSTTRLLAADQIVNTSDVQVSGAGSRLELNGNSETVKSLSVEAQGALIGTGNLTAAGAMITATNGQVTARNGTLTLTGGSITNNALFDARSNGTLDVVTPPTNFNAAAGTLTGGTWQVIGPATMRLRAANVSTLAATVVLDGEASSLYSGEAGTTDALSDLGTIAPGGTLIIRNGRNFTAPDGTTFTTSGTLNIGANSRFTAGGFVHKASGGTITRNATSKLDLKTHDLLFQSTPTARDADLAALTAAIASARNTSPTLWQGNGLTTSSATDLTGLGIAQNDDGTGQPLHATFNGVAADTSSILIKFTHCGDANVDGKVDVHDFFRIDRGRALNLPGWANGDFNYSGGGADGDDLMLADRGFLSQGAPLSSGASIPPPATLSAAARTVPEPSALTRVLAASLVLHRRRRGAGQAR